MRPTPRGVLLLGFARAAILVVVLAGALSSHEAWRSLRCEEPSKLQILRVIPRFADLGKSRGSLRHNEDCRQPESWPSLARVQAICACLTTYELLANLCYF